MSKIFVCIFSLFLFMSRLAAHPLPSVEYGGGPNYQDGCNHWAVEVSALYWKTSRDDRVYAGNIPGNLTTPSTLTYFTAKPKNDWGWRIWAGYQFSCPFFIDAEYTFFDQNVHSSADGANEAIYDFFAVDPYPEIGVAVKNEYQRFRGRTGFYLSRGSCGNIYAFGGIDWIHLKEKDRLDMRPAVTLLPGPFFVTDRSTFNGAGFEAGFGATWNLFRCAGINVEFNGVGALGRRTYSAVFSHTVGADPEFPIQLTNDYPNTSICVPGIDLRIEAFYTFHLCRPIYLAIGYEHHHFFDVLLLNDLFSNTSPSTVAREQKRFDLGFGGLTLSLGTRF